MAKKKTAAAAAEELDTTQLRNALDAAGVTFPRGYRLQALRALYREHIEGKPSPAVDINADDYINETEARAVLEKLGVQIPADITKDELLRLYRDNLTSEE